MIAVCGSDETGKTCTIRNVWDMLPADHKSKKVSINDGLLHEVWGYVDYDKDEKGFFPERSRIGVASRGDTSDEIREWVIPLAKDYDCDLIVCACHPEADDDTMVYVRKIATDYSFELIMFGNFFLESEDGEALKKKIHAKKSPIIKAGNVNLNRLSAKAIIELIEGLWT